MCKGSFIRSFDGDRKLSPYEIDTLLEDKTQPAHDAEIVADVTMDDLDKSLLSGVIKRQKTLHPKLFSSFSDEEIAINLRITAKDIDGPCGPRWRAFSPWGRILRSISRALLLRLRRILKRTRPPQVG